MNIKTSELEALALNWSVAKCEGYTISGFDFKQYNSLLKHNYSTDWAKGGPIIDRERLFITPQVYGYLAQSESSDGRGPTILVSAMRCYVASRLGNEVEVPDELTNGESA